jgi:hypothetical protein
VRGCKHCGRSDLDESHDFYPGKLHPSSRCIECERKRARETAKTRYLDPILGLAVKNRRKERESSAARVFVRRDLDSKRHKRDWSKRRLAQAEYFRQNKRKVYVRINGRMSKDPKLRLRKSVSNAIRMALTANGGAKQRRSVLAYLPYSMEELRNHLESMFESWMTWGNWGPYDPKVWTWQIDHITPQVMLPFSDFADANFLRCWALSNLRPMESRLNLQKGCRV